MMNTSASRRKPKCCKLFKYVLLDKWRQSSENILDEIQYDFHMKVKCLQRKKGSKKDILRKEIDPQKHLISPVYFVEASSNQWFLKNLFSNLKLSSLITVFQISFGMLIFMADNEERALTTEIPRV